MDIKRLRMQVAHAACMSVSVRGFYPVRIMMEEHDGSAHIDNRFGAFSTGTLSEACLQ